MIKERRLFEAGVCLGFSCGLGWVQLGISLGFPGASLGSLVWV